MADSWQTENTIPKRNIYMPIPFENEVPVLKWFDSWDLSFLDKGWKSS